MKLKLVFECDDCKRRFRTWTAVEKHLNLTPTHVSEGLGLVNVYLRDAWNELSL